MNELIENIDACIAKYQVNVRKMLVQQNKAAGIRARKATMELTQLFKDFRKESVNYTK